MKYRVRLFARARDLAGTDRLEVELPPSSRVADLRRALVEVCPGLGPLLARSAVAVNGDFVGDETELVEDAEIALLPPVSGG
jgi:molybdopterin converting factor small subunit